MFCTCQVMRISIVLFFCVALRSVCASGHYRDKLGLLVLSTRASRLKQLPAWSHFVSTSKDVFSKIGINEDATDLISVICDNEVKVVNALWGLSAFKVAHDSLGEIAAVKGKAATAKALVKELKSDIDVTLTEYIESWRGYNTALERYKSGFDFEALITAAIETVERVRDLTRSVSVEKGKSVEIATYLRPILDNSEEFGAQLCARAQLPLSQWLTTQRTNMATTERFRYLVNAMTSNALVMFEILTNQLSRTIEGKNVDISPEVAMFSIQDIVRSMIVSLLLVLSPPATQVVALKWATVMRRFHRYKLGRDALPVFQDDMVVRVGSFRVLRRKHLKVIQALLALKSVLYDD